MTSQIDIANRALIAAGAREQIVSFTEGSTSAIACNTLFQSTFEELARNALWNCLRYQTPLTLLKAAQGTPENPSGTALAVPPQPWLYEYLLPPDCLYVRYLQPTFVNSISVPLFPTSGMTPYAKQQDDEIDFSVATDKVNGSLTKVILTNLSSAQIVYTQNNSNPDFWESEFQAAMVASFAAYLIPALNLNMQLLSMQNKIAENLISIAKQTDGNEGVVSQNREASWITARGAGRYIGNDPVGDLSWPLG